MKGIEMNKTTPTTGNNIWDDVPAEKPTRKKPDPVSAQAPDEFDSGGFDTDGFVSRDFDLEGLMTDFPTAKELERFVFDETGVVLNLKGRANKLKYQVAMDVLNGQDVDPRYIGTSNPYLEKTDMVPEEPMKALPPRDPDLPPLDTLQNSFFTGFVPHSDPDYHAQGRKMHCLFRKYKNGVISYEVQGPIEPRPVGEKIDKWGKVRPEIIRWVDPRTGEQLVQREDGTLTPIGRRLKAMMQTMKYNDSNQWVRYIDRDFISLDQRAAQNPWDLEE
jgi:hypothetical protein